MEQGFIVLQEDSFDDLYFSTVGAFPDTKKRQYVVNDVNVRWLRMTKNGEGLRVNSQTTTINGDNHKQAIIFKTGMPTDLSSIEDIDATDVHVRCNCLDFRWRFATWNSRNDALYGRAPGPYRRKTNRPPVNPTQAPGVCKHLIALFDELIRRQ